MIRKACPDCGRVHGTISAEKAGVLDICCRECHAKRIQRLHRHDSPPDGYDQTPIDGKYCLPVGRCIRPNASGRRVIRKPEPMAG